LRIKVKSDEEYRDCGRICHQTGGVDEEFPEAPVEDRKEHHLRTYA
jgi:hypothetical protein